MATAGVIEKLRPEWGLLAMTDLGTTLQTLVDDHGLVLAGADAGSTPASTMRVAARAGPAFRASR